MNLLDTDAVSHHLKMNAIGQAIEARLAADGPDFRVTAVTTFEMVGGALQLYRDLKKKRRGLIPGFNLIQEVAEYLGGWRGRILPYDAAADRIYRAFPSRIRQEMEYDARIAAIALAHDAAVWTLNVRDFKKIPDHVVVQADTSVIA